MSRRRKAPASRRVQVVQERRRSNAAGVHQSRRPRGEVRRRVIEEETNSTLELEDRPS